MEAYDDVSCTWSVVGRMPCPMSHLAVTGANVSTCGLTRRINGGRVSSSSGGPVVGGGGGGGGGVGAAGGVGVGAGGAGPVLPINAAV